MLAELARSFRLLRKYPGFALLAGFTLALGIGLNTAMFSVIHAILLAPLPYPNPEQVVSINTEFTNQQRNIARVTGGDLLDLERETGIFRSIGYYGGGQVGLQLNNRAEFAYVTFTDSGFLRVFNVAPTKGRWYTPEDKEMAVVSRTFALRNFGSLQAALNQVVNVENTAYRIAGVMPDSLDFPAKTEVWVHDEERPQNTNRNSYNYRAVARLSTTVGLANARLKTLAAQLATTEVDNKYKNFLAIPLQDQLTNTVRGTLWILMAAVALVLLIACSNVANLMLARASGRSREISVRLALGASRWQLMRQLLSESVALALPGAAAGVVLAYWTLDLLVRLAPAGLPRLDHIHVDPITLAFAISASLIAAVASGLAPAFHLASSSDLSALHMGLKLRSTQSGKTRNALVVAEIAVCVTLVVGSALLLKTFLKLNSEDLGFDRHDVLVAYAHAPAKGLKEVVAASKMFSALLPELESIPGVAKAAGAMGMPAGQYGSNGQYEVNGQELPRGTAGPQALFRLSSPNYFATMSIPLLRGRDFTNQDGYDEPFVAIISDSLARQSYPNENPVGKLIRCGLDSPKWMTIVGVVADINSLSPATPKQPELYMPLEQHPFMANEVQLAVRARQGVPLETLTASVREKILKRSPLTALRFTTLDEMLDGAIGAQRFRAFLVTTFAGLALLLAVAGVYGMMSYWTAQRTPEIGLRVALGATPRELIFSVLKQAVRLSAIGLAIGVPVSLASSRVLQGLLFGVTAADPATYVIAAAILLAITVAAAAVPAWRASRVDPLTSLRQD